MIHDSWKRLCTSCSITQFNRFAKNTSMYSNNDAKHPWTSFLLWDTQLHRVSPPPPRTLYVRLTDSGRVLHQTSHGYSGRTCNFMDLTTQSWEQAVTVCHGEKWSQQATGLCSPHLVPKEATFPRIWTSCANPANTLCMYVVYSSS